MVAFNGRPAVSRVELEIAPGEALAIVGPSGAGKTTLLRLLDAALGPTAGGVRIDELDPWQLSERELRELRAGIGFVHQDHALVPNLRVCQNVISGRLGRRGFWSGARSMIRPGRRELEEVHALLGRVGLADRLFHLTSSLSGGEQQRVALARALYQGPSVLLADEPVASVDPTRARDLLRLLREVASQDGLTYVASLHDLALARELFPRLVGLRGGEIMFDAAPDAVDESTLTELYRIEERREP